MDTADKKEPAELTAQDREVLTRYLARHEKSARRWRYTRYVTLCFVCLLYFNGFYGLSSAYNDAMTPLDQKDYIAKLSTTGIPTDVTERHWIVGYVNKVAVVVALERKEQSATQLLGIGGAIMLTVALVSTILLVNHWNDGEWNIVMVKLIRGYVQKQAE
jgi:hypothetical protein